MSLQSNARVRFSYALLILFPVGSAVAIGNAVTVPAPPAAATQPAGQPVINVDASEHDFGEVRAGEQVEHRFKITNTGSAELQITNVKPGCGCTVAGDYPRTLAPGGSGELPLVLRTNGMNGQFNKAVTVSSNDQTKPQLVLSLKGNAKPLIALQPASINFGSIYGDKSQTQTISITNNTESPLKLVLDPLASSNGWQFELVETEPGKTFELKAAFHSKGLKPGAVRQSVLLLSNVQLQHQVTVPTIATIRDRVEAEPATLTIVVPSTQPAAQQAGAQDTVSGQPPASQPAAFPRLIRVQNYGDIPVKVTGATCENAAVNTTVREVDPGKNYLLVVTLPRDYIPAPGDAVVIRTDDADKPVLQVPIVVTRPFSTARLGSVISPKAGDTQQPG